MKKIFKKNKLIFKIPFFPNHSISKSFYTLIITIIIITILTYYVVFYNNP